MIVLPSQPHHMPYIKVGSNNLAIFRDDWLQDILVDAAQETNVPRWLAEDISKGICQYIEKSYEGSVIESEELFSRISTTLTSVGLKDMADQVDCSPPTVRVSLTDLARRSRKEYDLAFFQLLEDKCNEILQSGITSVECHGLIKCSQALTRTGIDQWSPEANEIKERILSRIDDFRREGELRNPIFNVSVIY